jgi:hypothetical protein
MEGEPFHPSRARPLIRQILKSGTVIFTKHADAEMAKDDITAVDCANVLRGGVVEEPELENETWRYRVRTDRMCFVIAFRSKTCLVVVTGWRIRR